MNWYHGPRTWTELERVLSGRPNPRGQENPHPGDGSDAPAWSRRRGEYTPPQRPRTQGRVPYAELHAHTAFSFLDGASSPEAMAEAAAELGLTALAITDHDGLYGVVRFAEAASELGLATVFGAELSLPGGEHLLVLARGGEGYRRLSRAIARAHLRGGAKGEPRYELAELAEVAGGHWYVLTGCRRGRMRTALERGGVGASDFDTAAAGVALTELVELFGRDRVVVELTCHGVPEDTERCDALAALAAEAGLPVVATTAAHCAGPEDARLASVMAALGARRALETQAAHLPAAGGAYLRSGEEMAELFDRWPGAVSTAARLGEECAFDLQLIAPELPPFDVPEGYTEDTRLAEFTYAGAARRYGRREEAPEAYAQIDRELGVIADLGFPGYFLVVHDIVEFCHREGILCQGRGSAANSAVCYSLGITNVDPVGAHLLFERFLSPERDGPPDIDVDIESGRREEAIQYVYSRYGRDHAAQVANVITYRGRSAVRDIARALGYSTGQQDAWSKSVDRWSGLKQHEREAAEHTVPPDVLALARRLVGLPRHLGIHSGGMVICDRPVADVVPVEWARMPGRTVLQWDKDDCAAVGLVKFDMLGLGMLTALHHAIDLAAEHKDLEVDLARLDLADPAVYEMLCRGDSVGVFQVESRAQMATLPRLRPRTFYDLVVEVALIRPGPIQGGSVHPYIRRRNGREEVVFDHPALEAALGRTLGIPLFQEQLMQIATEIAGFTGAEADQLRRAMGAKRSPERMARLRERFFAGMRELHGIGTGPPGTPVTGPEVGERIWEKMCAFANYGFPESHSQSFAAIVYYSAWFKCHHPAVFCAALLRSQPMGFYSPQSLVADARRHGVTVHRPCVNRSLGGATCENRGTEVRLGLESVRAIGTDLATAIADERDTHGPYLSAADLAGRTGLTVRQMEALATAGALDALGVGGRRSALWSAATAARQRPGMLPGLSQVDAPALPGMSVLELTSADLAATGISPEEYPTVHARPWLDSRGVCTTAGLAHVPDGSRVEVAGAVTHRQRPATAEGVTFLSLEDETGMTNVVCSVGLWARYRPIVSSAPALIVRGTVENRSGAVSVVADKIERLHLGMAIGRSRDFR
ncbi:error-prone DNA polymerase [Dietzia sp. PP-33]|uniref:error-prone DNA polymerase n=1 Tax=Dietzia sp. PP-33 TaxID=2957500 RepID=UPI0029A9EEA9|nr:error-prone DNA polymerase [Dietzia sp. PP-33]MDX2356761.1 error-prone DNA polymerase [Dietzia sp. PP-33]